MQDRHIFTRSIQGAASPSIILHSPKQVNTLTATTIKTTVTVAAEAAATTIQTTFTKTTTATIATSVSTRTAAATEHYGRQQQEIQHWLTAPTQRREWTVRVIHLCPVRSSALGPEVGGDPSPHCVIWATKDINVIHLPTSISFVGCYQGEV